MTALTLSLPDTQDGIARAAHLLRTGHLVAFPTETVYGLGADATNPEAVAAIFAAKARPAFNPLICHFHSAQAAFAHTCLTPELHNLATRLAVAFWPGPLTLVLPRHPASPIAPIAAAGLPTLAIRVPNHPTALALLAAINRPIAAPSANRSGRISPTHAHHVHTELNGRIAAILQSGPASIGLESTVLDLSNPHAPPRLLRPGAITQTDLTRLIGFPLDGAPSLSPSLLAAPGMLASHYAPTLPLRLNATHAEPHEALLAFGPNPPHATLTRNLSPSGNLHEAAANLFALLRELDTEAPAHNLTSLAASPIPTTDIGTAINDRLTRAAAPRPASA